MIFAELYAENVIESRHRERLDSYVSMTSAERNLKLIEIIQRRTQSAFDGFLHVFRDLHQRNVLEIFETGVTDF